MFVDPSKSFEMPPPYPTCGPVISSKLDVKTGNRHTTIFLKEDIGELSRYVEVLEVFQSAIEGDAVDLMLDTPGGNVFTAMIIVDYMLRCKGKVTCHAVGMVASAGTIIFGYAPHQVVEPWSKFLFHMSMHNCCGNSVHMEKISRETVNYMKEVFKMMLSKGLITKEEYMSILSNKRDVTLSAGMLRARLLSSIASTESIHLFNEEGEEVTPKAPAPETGKIGENGVPEKPEDSPEGEGVDEEEASENTEEPPVEYGDAGTVENKKRKAKKDLKKKRRFVVNTDEEEEAGEGDDDDEGSSEEDDDSGNDTEEGGEEGEDGEDGEEESSAAVEAKKRKAKKIFKKKKAAKKSKRGLTAGYWTTSEDGEGSETEEDDDTEEAGEESENDNDDDTEESGKGEESADAEVPPATDPNDIEFAADRI